MMIWALVILLVLACFVLAAFVLKAERSGWEAIGAALLIGVAGYAMQGSPGQPGAAKAPAAELSQSGAASVAARQQIGGNTPLGANQWMVIADAMARNGQFGDAASVLMGAVNKDPRNADAWVALGNALVGHAEGNLTPAALYAYRRAAVADPEHPGPSFFLGMALAQGGRFAEARQLWAQLLARSPKDAPWRADLVERLARLDAFIAAQ